MGENEKRLVPKLRFPEFRDEGDWDEKELIQIAKRVTQRNSENTEKRVLTNSAADGVIDQKDYFKKDIANHKNLDNYFVVEEGDYVYNPRISSIAPVGPISKNKIGIGVMSPLYTVFQFHNPNNDFFEQYFQSSFWHEYLKEVSNKGARHDRMSISNSDFMKMPLPLPSPEEQQKIADCLTSIDELIFLHTQKINALKDYKKGLMQQLFPAVGEKVPRLRFPEFRDAGKWESATVLDLINDGVLYPNKDGNHGNIHPKSSDYVKPDTNNIPFVMATDLENGKVNFETCKYITKTQADGLQKGFAKEGDVLLTHKGTIGEVVVVEKNNYPYLMLTPQVTYYRIKNESLLCKYYLAQLFRSDLFQNRLRTLSGGGTRAYVGITEQKSLKLFYPSSLKEQTEIANCLSRVDGLIIDSSSTVNLLNIFKKGLIQQLFPSTDERNR